MIGHCENISSFESVSSLIHHGGEMKTILIELGRRNDFMSMLPSFGNLSGASHTAPPPGFL